MTTPSSTPTQYYAGGFLYNPDTQEVLLHQRDDKTDNNPNLWSFFGGMNEVEDMGIPVNTFIREVREEIGLDLDPTQITFLCDYFSEKFNTMRFSFYALDKTPEPDLTLGEGAGFKWMSIDEALGLNLGPRSRSDLELFKSQL